VDEFARIVRITSDELDNSGGDGSTCNDIVLTGQTTANLRAERDGSRNGRVYTVVIAVKDKAGNETTTSFKVQVPHDQPGAPATDDGPQYCVGTACGATPGSNCQ